jgi:hypothetical protein
MLWSARHGKNISTKASISRGNASCISAPVWIRATIALEIIFAINQCAIASYVITNQHQRMITAVGDSKAPMWFSVSDQTTWMAGNCQLTNEVLVMIPGLLCIINNEL